MKVDQHLAAVRSHLKLCENILKVRAATLHKRSVGMLLRNNQIAHNAALLGLVEELREIAEHDPQRWWVEPSEDPF